MHFFYDEQKQPAMLEFNGTLYSYVHNLQGDVTGLIDSNGNLVIEYGYDVRGKLMSVRTLTTAYETLAEMNPFRYRGYVYDEETKLYYGSNRYYAAETGRWINADDPEIIDGDNEGIFENNLYTYCFNNVVNMEDDTGHWPKWVKKIAIGVGAIVVGAAVVAATVATGGAAAAFVGAVVVGVKAAAISGVIGAAFGAVTNAIRHRISTGSWDGAWKAAIDGAVDGFVDGFMTGGIMAGASMVLSSGFKIAANAGVSTGRNGGLTIGNKIRILSPNHPTAYDAGGTLLKIGSKYKNVRIDVGIKSLLHMNIQLAKKVNYHLPFGTLGAGLWGGLSHD